MPDRSFRPRPGRYGVQPAYVVSEKIGTITSAATDIFRIPTPFRRVAVSRISAQAQVVPVVTTGTSTATLFKRRASDDVEVTLTAGFDLETLLANESKKFAPLSTASEADLTVQEGDTLLVKVVNGTTIATQPVALFFVVELSVLE